MTEVRSGKREGFVVSIKTLDLIDRHDQETWEVLRRELEDIGTSTTVITEKRSFIVAWYQEAVAAGTLEEDAPVEDRFSEDNTDSILAIYEQISPIDDGKSDNSSCSRQGGPVEENSLCEAEEEIARKLGEKGKIREQAKEAGSRVRDRERDRERDHLDDIYEETIQTRGVGSSAEWYRPSPSAHQSAQHGLAIPRLQDGHYAHNFTMIDFSNDKRHLRQPKQKSQSRVSHLVNKILSKSARLLEAAEAGDEATARELLFEGVSVNTKDTDDQTPLHLASRMGHCGMISLLLQSGADVSAADRYNFSPSCTATGHKQTMAVDLLLNNGASYEAEVESLPDIHSERPMLPPLHWAAMMGPPRTLQLLLENGSHIDSRSSKGETALYIAAKEGDLSVVQMQLNKNATVDAKNKLGMTPLY